MERIPPHNAEAEKSVLGAILLNKEAMYEVGEILSGADFYYEKHKEIFEAVETLQRKNEPADVLTVSDELKKRGSLDMVGGRGYVASLANEVPTTTNAAAYAKIVFEAAELRKVLKIASELTDQGYEKDANAEAVLEYAEAEIFQISQKKGGGTTANLNEVLKRNLEMIDERARNKGGLTGIPSGLTDLDQVTTGFQPADLIILAARPSMGKTAFALNLAQRASAKGHKIMIFSLEMAKEQLGMRLLAMESRIDSQKLKLGEIENSQWEKLYLAIDNLTKGEIVIDDTAGITLGGMKNKCRKQKIESGLDMIVVDYLQLMEGDKSGNTSREQVVSALSRGLKQLAREMKCPIIALSQLSRAAESRTDHRPMLSDLRESGAIEQDADQVLFLYRDEVYNKEESEKPGVCEVIVAKNRNGPIGTVDVAWQAAYTRFANLQHGGI